MNNNLEVAHPQSGSSSGLIPSRIGICNSWSFWFLRRGENRSTRRKTSQSKGENQKQTQPTYGVEAGIGTRAILVGGECSNHCATLAPPRGGVFPYETLFCSPRAS